MKTKFFTLAFVLIAFTQLLSAQTDGTGYKSWQNGLGFSTGYSTGVGLSYRHFFNKLGAQVTFGPYMTKETTTTSVGFSFLYDLVRTNKSSFSAYQGNHYLYSRYQKTTLSGTYGEISTTAETKENLLVTSLGIGYEFLVFDRIGISLMGGYAHSARDYDANSIFFTGELAALYKF